MERPMKTEHRSILGGTMYPDQCWEVDPGRTVLTQYIARNPHAIRSTFRVGNLVRIDGKVYAIDSTTFGYFGVNDCEWCVTTICYFLKPSPFDREPKMGGWQTITGNIIEPEAIPTVTTGALYNQRVRDDGEVYDLNAELDEARNRYKLVVFELEKIRKRVGKVVL